MDTCGLEGGKVGQQFLLHPLLCRLAPECCPHWCSQVEDIGRGGVSYVELLLLN